MNNLPKDPKKIIQTPLIDGDQATFVWYGKPAPHLIGDFNNWDEDRAIELEKRAKGVYSYTLTFPKDAYIEYAFVRDRERTPDPLNKRMVYNGQDAMNHYFYMPEGKKTPLAKRKKDAAKGTTQRYTLENEWFLIKGKRRVDLYRPAAPGPYPLLVVYDGKDYLKRASLTRIVDNLIHKGRIQPIALAMIDHAGQARGVEYSCSDALLGFLVEELLPFAKDKLDLLSLDDNPGGYAVMGASMGGLMALYTGVRLPHIFGRVLSQSGAFHERSVVYDLIRANEKKALKIWMDIGIYDFLYEQNQQMHDLLQSKEYEVSYQEYPGGHNYSAWRDDVWRGLEYLFNGR